MTAVDLFWICVFFPIALFSLQASRRIFNYWFTPLSVFLVILAYIYVVGFVFLRQGVLVEGKPDA